METGRILAISTLRALLVLQGNEEKKLRSVLADIPTFKVKMQARFDLERLVRKKNAQVDELAKLEAGQTLNLLDQHEERLLANVESEKSCAIVAFPSARAPTR